MAAKIRVISIQRLCVNDGPGVRTVAFLKGCYLQCPWCCNPEAIHYEGDEYFDKGRCKCPEKNPICRNCELHGGNMPKDGCPFGGYEKTYKDYTADELYGLLMRDEPLYRDGGGVTFSGGEPLLQAFAIKPLLQRLKKENVHIAFETTLYAPREQYQAVKEYVDYWLVDLKFQFGYIANRDYDIGMNRFEENLLDLQSLGKSIVYRMVVMEEMIGRLDSIVQRLIEHHISGIELLNYHGLAKNKYLELSKPFKNFTSLSQIQWSSVTKCMSEKGLTTQVNQI